MMRFANVGALRLCILVWQSCHDLSFANLAEGWGGPSHIVGDRKHQDARHLEASDQDTATVMLTAGGTLQRGHPLEKPMMRRHADEAESEDFVGSLMGVHEEGPPHKVHNTKELFRAMDLNGDGMLTKTEISDVSNEVATSETKEESEHHTKPTTNGIQEFIGNIDKDGDGAINLREFRQVFKDGQFARPHKSKDIQGAHSTKHVHRHRHHGQHKADQHLAAHEEHSTREDAKLLQVQTSTPISCGGHTADNCSACVGPPCNPVTLDRCCNGICKACNGTCVLNTTTCIAPTPAPATVDSDQATWTAEDQKIADDAAANAIREQNIEASESAKHEEEEAEKKKFSWSKFWLIVIITFSVILGICAIVSVVALIVFCCMGVADPVAKELIDDDGEGEEDDGGEEHDEAAAGES